VDGVCWWNPRPREKKKTKRCASPTWGPLPEEFESMGGPRSSLGFPSMRPIQLIIFFVAVIGGAGLLSLCLVYPYGIRV
jgi:hypothetical protein